MWKNLTTRWLDYSQTMQSAIIVRTGLREMETNRLWNWRLTVPKTIKMMLVRPLVTNFKMTVRADCAVSACSSLPLSIKALAPWLSGGKSAFEQVSASPSPAELLASKIKQIFISTNLASLLAFERRAASWAPLSWRGRDSLCSWTFNVPQRPHFHHWNPGTSAPATTGHRGV